MFISLSDKDFHLLMEQNLVTPVSRWENKEKAKSYYSSAEGIYVAFEENMSKLKSAYSTPVRIYFIENVSNKTVINLLTP